MPRLPQPRDGAPLIVKGRPLNFSFFPVRKGANGYGLNDIVFAIDPWAIIEGAVTEQVADSTERDESLAFVAQARAFYEAARSPTPASPLLAYYAFLNLGKAIIRCRGFPGSLDWAKHGLSDGGLSVPAANLRAGAVTIKDKPGQVNVFAELIERLGFERPIDEVTVPVPELAPQVVVGHRLWREASNRRERFVGIEEIQFINDIDKGQLWLRIWLRKGDLSRYNLTYAQVVDEGGLTGQFAAVKTSSLTNDDDLVCLEQLDPVTYTRRPTDVVLDVVASCRSDIWSIITADAGNSYRRYYLHLTPASEVHRQPQIAAMWMLIFFFGSVVRYRPHAFAAMARENYGAWINDFIAAQPEQLLFMLASEMRRREVARPAIV